MDLSRWRVRTGGCGQASPWGWLVSFFKVGMHSSLSRRGALAAAALGAAFLAAPARARQSATPATGGGAWTYTDDAGTTISLSQRPERVVAYLPLAAALWDFGLQPVGYYGVALRPDGTRETIAGDLDLDSLVSLGPEYGGFDLERLVELHPQLIINDMWEHPADFWGLEPETVAQIEAIAPITNILFVERPITETLAKVEQLAAALGADLDAAQVDADRAAFDDAVTELKEAISAKPGLTVAFVSGRPEESFWVGNPMKLADLYFYKDLGLDIVQPDDKEHFSEELSWEQAGKYPADLLIIDDRQWSATGEELVAQVPTFAILPAAKAGAFASWPSEYVPSYRGMTPVLKSLAETIRDADPDIV